MSALWVGQLLLAFMAGVVLLGGYSLVDAVVRHFAPIVAAWMANS